jgi:Fe-S cluster assembly protein SufB
MLGLQGRPWVVHIGKNTRSTIISKGISAGQGNNTYRGMVI